MSGVIAAVVVALLKAALALGLNAPADPTRYCYAHSPNQPWDCYLAADRLTDQTPVWVGPESKVRSAAAVNNP